MGRRPSLLLAAMLFGSTCAGQAPIERRAPVSAQPAVQAPSMWPATARVPMGAKLLVGTFDTMNPRVCSVVGLDEFRLVCRGPRFGNDVAYERPLVESLKFAPKSYEVMQASKIAAFEGGGLGLALSLGCGVDGGPVCRTPSIVGLSLLETGVVLQFVQVHVRHQQSDLYRSTARRVHVWGPWTP